MSVRFKAVDGKVDRAGGVVARLKDKDNYYVARANALEDNVRLDHVVAGKRVQFAGEKAKVSSGEWHSLKLEARGKHLADSVTLFDDLKLERLETQAPQK